MRRPFAWLAATAKRRPGLALALLCVAIYVPCAGHYGLWDPWETHYGEIARQMVRRGDLISLWWPCSPIDRPEVWHKPVLSFWLMAAGLKLAGLEGAGASPSELVDSWRAEWALRMPFVLLGLVGVAVVWQVVRRLAGTRAAFASALVLATSTQWLLIAHQAMTDMAFVVPMTAALGLAALALLDDETECERALPRRQAGRFSWPHAPSFYGFLALFAGSVVPQLIVDSVQLHAAIPVGKHLLRLPGVVAMSPYAAAFLVAVWWSARARCRRQLLLFSAYALCGLAMLAKGPAGVALPALVLIAYLLVSERPREILTRLELPRGALLLLVVALPWYHAMLIRHGQGFWNEFIGDNYLHRASGRNGDRGTFEYYLAVLGSGLFPWSGVAALGTLRALAGSFLRRAGRSIGSSMDRREALARFALVWCVVEYAVVSLVNTKFHHYILPVLPPLAILAGLFLDELVTAPRRWHTLGLVTLAAPLVYLCGRDLAAEPARIHWLFNYDYVAAPHGGRPWPSPAEYGDHFQYGNWILMITLAMVAATLLAAVLLRRRAGAELPGPRWSETEKPRPVPLVPLFALAVVWSVFLADKFLVELSPHWSQKHVIAAYYARRAGAAEPLVVWQLYWRGESFYTRNAIHDAPAADERTVFLNDHAAEKLQHYLAAHGGRRVFFLFDRGQLEPLRRLLPADAQPTLTVVDHSNNKLYLAEARL